MTTSSAIPRRIVVMMLGDIGDVLLATPALRRLRDVYPRAAITAMTKPATVEVLAGSGLVDGFLPVEKGLFDRPADLLRPAVGLRMVRYVADLRRRRFDTVVLLHHLVTWWGTAKLAGLTLASGAQVRAGLDNGRGLFLTHRARDDGFDAAHEAEYWLRVVAAMADPSGPRAGRPRPKYSVRSDRARAAAEPITGETPPVPTFVVPDSARAVVDGLLAGEGMPPAAPMLAVHPGSGRYSTARRWFPERFAAVADRLAAERGLRVVVVGGPDEHDLAASVIALMTMPAANLAGRTSLAELGAVLARCALLVGNDAGVAHLASAVGTPVVAVFGPFNHHTWRPLGRSLVVRADPALPCMPCVNRGFARGYPEGCPPRYCLQEVSADMVMATAERLLGPAPYDATRPGTEGPMAGHGH